MSDGVRTLFFRSAMSLVCWLSGATFGKILPDKLINSTRVPRGTTTQTNSSRPTALQHDHSGKESEEKMDRLRELDSALSEPPASRQPSVFSGPGCRVLLFGPGQPEPCAVIILVA